VAALDRAVALVEVQAVAVLVGEHLDLHVARFEHVFSTSMRASPNDDCASRWAEARASASWLSSSTTFMPLPPPPALALSSTG
jgi:hypothetical protein